MSLLDAARNGDFIAAKDIFDQQEFADIEEELIALEATDGRRRSVAHYAAQFDELIVIEWLHSKGVNFFDRDDSNKCPIEISVLVDAKLKLKKKASEVLPFFKRVVLNAIQQIFFIEFAESSLASVSEIADLESLTIEELTERFPFHNNLQAAHVFAMDDRIDLIKYMHKTRGVDLTEALDDDLNTPLHFATSQEMAMYLINECQLDVNAQNSSDGYTPCHAVIEKIAIEEMSREIGIRLIEVLVENGANLALTDNADLGVAELAIELLGVGEVVNACLLSASALSGKPIEEYLHTRPQIPDSDSDDSLSVASHDDNVIAESEDEEEDEEEHLETIREE